MSLGTDLAAAVAIITQDAALLRAIVQGPAGGGTSIVTLPGGSQIKTLARIAQEVAGGHLPLAGGTLTGTLTMAGGASIRGGALDASLALHGGVVFNDGGGISLRGPNSAYNPGGLELYAGGAQRLMLNSAGNWGIGTSAAANVGIYIAKNITGAATVYELFLAGVIQSDVTTSVLKYASVVATAAASFTVPAVEHFSASQGTIGAGSAITNQRGFVAQNTLTGAANNFGFVGSIAAGSGRWNGYFGGTAPFYIAGGVGIGNTTIDAKLDVAGDIAITDGMTAPGATSGKAKIYVDSADGDLKVKFGDGTVKTIVVDT